MWAYKLLPGKALLPPSLSPAASPPLLPINFSPPPPKTSPLPSRRALASTPPARVCARAPGRGRRAENCRAGQGIEEIGGGGGGGFVQSEIPGRGEMKYVLVTGGVVSGLGKGVTASSIGVVLKACGLRITSIKIGTCPPPPPPPAYTNRTARRFKICLFGSRKGRVLGGGCSGGFGPGWL